MVTSLEFHQMVLHQKTRFPALAGSIDCVTIGSVVLTTAFDWHTDRQTDRQTHRCSGAMLECDKTEQNRLSQFTKQTAIKPEEERFLPSCYIQGGPQKVRLQTRSFLSKFSVKSLLKIPPCLAYVATLPCETLMSENKRLTINYRVV